MAFDGSGIFLRLRNWVTDATAGVKIRADFHDSEDDNFAAGLTNCITKDGQTTITQNIPMNSKRITALADPIDPQDAATKHYADTKAPLDGSAPFTGDVIIKKTAPALILDGQPGSTNGIYGQKNDKNRWSIILGNPTPETGSDAGSNFELINYHDDGTVIGDVLAGIRSTGLLTVKANPTAALGIATKQYVDAADATKLPLTGGTISGSLQVTGFVSVGSNVLYLSTPPGAGYLQWQGGGTYVLGGGGTVWHSGNFTPGAGSITSLQLIIAGQHNHTGEGSSEPFRGALATGFGFPAQFPDRVLIVTYRYLQAYIGGTWYTIDYGN